MIQLISMLASAVLAVGAVAFVTPLFPAPVVEPIEQSLGAALPSATAVFETSLAAPISSSATTMTLTANAVRGGGSISGYACFTVDEGSAQAETICGTVSGTTVSSLTRGISQATGTTTDSDLQFAHRRGANVKITDFPIIQILKAQNNGEDTFENIIRYTNQSAASFTNANDIINRAYADSLAFGAVPASSETASGFVELASGCEAASSTSSGSTARLSIPASMGTSTRTNATLGACKVVVSNNVGFIDANFIPTTTIFAEATFTGTTTVATAPIVYTYDLAGSPYTWTKRTGLKYIDVEAWGAGGGAARATSGGSSGGGGGGTYTKRRIFAADLGSTETVTIPAGGLGATSDNTDGAAPLANTTFGALVTAYGGGGGGAQNGSGGGGGGGGGALTVGGNASTDAGAAGGTPDAGAAGGDSSSFGGGGGGSGAGTRSGGDSAYGGGGGGGGNDTSGGGGGASWYGGAGGGSGGDGASSGGTSLYGGNGGAGTASGAGTVGSVPGGGGGGGGAGNGGNGGAGRVKVTEYYF